MRCLSMDAVNNIVAHNERHDTERFPLYLPFVRVIHWSLVTKVQ